MKFKLSKKEKIVLDKVKPFAWIIPFLAGVFLIWFLFLEIILPLGLGVANTLIAIFNVWRNLEDVNFIFIGAIFFFIILWKFFVALVSVWLGIFKAVMEYFNENFKKTERGKK